MIDTIFRFAGQVVLVRVKGNEITFGAKTSTSPMMAPIEGLKLDYTGTIREFPDLETSDNWREEAIVRFKTKVISLPTEDEKMEYIIKDLAKFGYEPLYLQKAGFRVKKFMVGDL
jgi:hypothetical protein